jgi:hypothetical protein
MQKRASRWYQAPCKLAARFKSRREHLQGGWIRGRLASKISLAAPEEALR